MSTDPKDARASRDVAGVGPDPKQTRHLTPLSELKSVKIATDEPDIREWPVYASNGLYLGRIDDLLIDTSRAEVVMLDIDLKGTDRHTLAPIRAAWIDRKTKRVVLDGARFNVEEELPWLARRTALTDEDVRRFGDRYTRVYGEHARDPHGDVRLRWADDELRIGRRSGSADVPAGTPPAAAASGAPVAEREPTTVERRRIPPDDPYWRSAATRTPAERQEVRLPPEREGRGVVVEETVVRRRVVDPADVPPDAVDRARSDAHRGGEQPPRDDKR